MAAAIVPWAGAAAGGPGAFGAAGSQPADRSSSYTLHHVQHFGIFVVSERLHLLELSILRWQNNFTNAWAQ